MERNNKPRNAQDEILVADSKKQNWVEQQPDSERSHLKHSEHEFSSQGEDNSVLINQTDQSRDQQNYLEGSPEYGDELGTSQQMESQDQDGDGDDDVIDIDNPEDLARRGLKRIQIEGDDTEYLLDGEGNIYNLEGEFIGTTDGDQ